MVLLDDILLMQMLFHQKRRIPIKHQILILKILIWIHFGWFIFWRFFRVFFYNLHFLRFFVILLLNIFLQWIVNLILFSVLYIITSSQLVLLVFLIECLFVKLRQVWIHWRTWKSDEKICLLSEFVKSIILSSNTILF